MEFWQQILAAALGVLMIVYLFPGIKGSMARSKNAEEKHWGTVLLLAVALIGFVLFLVASLQ